MFEVIKNGSKLHSVVQVSTEDYIQLSDFLELETKGKFTECVMSSVNNISANKCLQVG